eukprot:COSAG01_NODE_2487_length_7592_cov_4.423328_5_plen_239_part_00
MLLGFFNSALAIVMTLPVHMPCLLREHNSGCYSITALYLAKTLADVPFECLFSLIWSCLMYWLIGFRDDFSNFVTFFLLVFVVSLTAVGIGYFAGMAAAQPQIGFLLVLLNVLPAMLFGGFFINLASIPVGVEWLKEISVVRYAYSLICINQWSTFGKIPCTAEDIVDIGGCPYPDGNAVLAYLDIDESKWGRDLAVVRICPVLYVCFLLCCFVPIELARSASLRFDPVTPRLILRRS